MPQSLTNDDVVRVRSAYPSSAFRCRVARHAPWLLEVRWSPTMEWVTVTVSQALERARRVRAAERRTRKGKRRGR